MSLNCIRHKLKPCAALAEQMLEIAPKTLCIDPQTTNVQQLLRVFSDRASDYYNLLLEMTITINYFRLSYTHISLPARPPNPQHQACSYGFSIQQLTVHTKWRDNWWYKDTQSSLLWHSLCSINHVIWYRSRLYLFIRDLFLATI